MNLRIVSWSLKLFFIHTLTGFAVQNKKEVMSYQKRVLYFWCNKHLLGMLLMSNSDAF